MNLFDLTDRAALVAGGTGDLGKAMTEGLLDAGARVVVLGRAPGITHLEAELSQRYAGRFWGVKADLSARAALAQGFAHAVDLLGGRLDILVNAQGIQRRYKAEDFPLDAWDEILEVNLTSVFELCQLAGRVMLAQGSGKIINIASLNSFTGGITIPAYASSKGGVAQLTKALSNEWAARGVNVNAIAPGYMATRMTSALQADEVRNRQILERIPLGRWGSPQDLVGPLLFLASAASDYVTGEILPVDGGWMGR